MKERNKKFVGQKVKEDAIINFVSRQAQEAILDPNLPESYKDAALEAALDAILRIADKRSEYNAECKENQRLEGRDLPMKQKKTKATKKPI